LTVTKCEKKSMNIVITDGFTLNPGDLSWKELESLGNIFYYNRTSPPDILSRCQDADIIITNKTPIGKDVIDAAPKLKMIAVTATGYNIIDVAAAKDKKIVVCNVPEYGTNSVAQHTFALLLELSNQVGKHAQTVREGKWVASVDWSYSVTPIIELQDKILGIVGLGKIGNQVARIATSFGMKIQYHRGKPAGVSASMATLENLFSTSDFVTLHCPLRPDNEQFVNAQLLSTMKPSAFLINTSRGQLINEQDLADALNKNIVAGAALDVLSKEPPPSINPLLNAKNCIITPHNAWISKEARSRLLDTSVKNVKTFLKGKPENVVS
jgi:glycerate dehydrogenase